MLAGDSAMQAEIIQDLQADVNRRVNAKPEEWLKVRLVAELYNRYYREARARRAERVVLSPIGLDQNTFISRQREMNSDFLRQIAKELYGFEVPGIQTIFAGIDADGPHLYVASGNELSSHDAVGFAAIGAGYWHADSQFMFAGHSRSKQAPETLLLTYAAKKRAEVAPGVGKTLICSG